MKHIDGRKEPYFTAANLERAFVVSKLAKDQAEKEGKEKKSVGDIIAEKGSQ